MGSPPPTQQAQPAPSASRPAYVLESEWDSSAGKVRDDVFGRRVSDLAAFKAEQDIRKNSLPQAPDKYEIKNSPNFKPPEGVKFEWDQNDPLLKNAREVAHKRGMDQESFSDFLDLYAANEISKQQNQSRFNESERAKLGPAVDQRIDAVETWLRARVGAKAERWLGVMRSHPVAEQIEIFEELARQFSHQGAADYSQSGRQQPDATQKMPAELKTFEQKRAWQDAQSGRVIQPSGRMAVGR